MSVCSCSNEFKLCDATPEVPAGMPFKRYIQKWYDDAYAYSDTIIITVYGVVWYVEDSVTKVIVIYDFVDLDDGTEELEEWLEFDAHRWRARNSSDYDDDW